MPTEIIDSSSIDLDAVEFEPIKQEGDIYDVTDSALSALGDMRRNASDLAKLRTGMGGQDILTEYNNAKLELESGASIEELKQEEMLKFANIADQQIMGFIRDHTVTDPEAVVNLIKNQATAKANLLAQMMDVDGPEMVTSEIYANESISDYQKRQSTAKSYAHGVYGKYVEEQGLGSYVWDLAVNMVTFDGAKDAADLVGKGEFATFTGLADFIQQWQALDPDEQTAAFPSVFERIKDAYDDNVVKVGNVVNLMYESGYSESIAIDFAFDALALSGPYDLFQLGKGVKTGISAYKAAKAVPDIPDMKAAKAAAGANSTPKKMQDLGNDKVAAEAASAAGVSEEASDILGMTKLDSVSTASIFRNSESPILGAPLDNLSDEMQKIHRSNIEAQIATKIDEIQKLRKGVSAGDARKLAIGSVEIPRKLEKLKAATRLLDKALVKIKKGKPTKNNKAAQEQMSLLDKQIKSNIVQMKALDKELKAVRLMQDSLKKSDDFSIEVAQLRAGHTPSILSRAINDAVHARSQPVKPNVKMAEAKKAEVENVAKGTAEEVAKVVTEARIVNAAESILKNPSAAGISQDFANQLEAMFKSDFDDLLAETERLIGGSVKADDVAKIKDREVDRIIAEASEAGEEVRIADITDMEAGKGFTVTFHRNGADDSFSYRYTINDSGVFEGASDVAEDQFRAWNQLLTPESNTKTIDSALVNDLTFAKDQASKIANRLKGIYQQTRVGLSRKQNAELDALLVHGDEQRQLFRIEDLEAGKIQTKLTDKGFEKEVIHAYYKTRAFYDELHSLRDHVIGTDLKFKGYKDIKYTDKEGKLVNTMGKPIEDFLGQSLKEGAKEGDIPEGFVFAPANLNKDISAYPTIKSVQDNLQDLKAKGFKLVKLFEPQDMKDGSKVHFAIVKDDTVSNLPKSVLNYVPGYIPRIYRSGYYYVKSRKNPTSPVTMFAAETRGIAEKVRLQAMADDPSLALITKQDREFTEAERLVVDADSYGGLYFSSRKQIDLALHKGDGQIGKLERASVADATERYLQNIASIMPMAEYRSAAMQRFINSVNFVSKQEGRAGNMVGFNDAMDLSPSKLQLFEHTREYLSNQLRIASKEEKGFRNTLLKTADSLYEGVKFVPKPVSDSVRKAILNVLDTDPVQELKGLTFNLNMGFFNVRQLLVQVQNAGIAASVSPKHAPGAVADALQMRAAVMSDKEEVWRAAAKFATQSEEEFVKTVRQFKESGLRDSIKQQADYDASILTIGGQTAQTMRKAASAGRVFFTEGELMARLISFNIARRSLGPKATTREIFDEHLRISMNMQSANAASWQKNALGVPTQYMQVFAKFYERMMPEMILGKNKWTPAERARVMAFQLGMYGTVGVPLFQEAYAYLADGQDKTPKQVEEEMPWIKEAFQEGVVGVVAQAFGFENDFSSSFSLVSGTFDNNITKFVEAVVDGTQEGKSDADIYSMLAGASGTTVARGVDAAGSILTAVQALVEDPSLSQLGGQTLKVLDSVAKMTSTWSAAEKAIFLHDVGIQSKSGSTLISASNFEDTNLRTLLARAMNFQTDIEAAYWQIKDVNKTRQELQKKKLKALRNSYNNTMKSGNLSTFHAEKAYLLEGLTPIERRKIQRSLIKGVTGKADFDRQAKQYLTNFALSGGRYKIDPATTEF